MVDQAKMVHEVCGWYFYNISCVWITECKFACSCWLDPALTISVPQDFHGCTQPFFIYAQNIMVYNLTAHNYVSLKDNPNKVYIKLKGIGCTIWKCEVKSFESRFMCFRKDRRKKKKKRLKNFLIFFHLTLALLCHDLLQELDFSTACR